MSASWVAFCDVSVAHEYRCVRQRTLDGRQRRAETLDRRLIWRAHLAEDVGEQLDVLDRVLGVEEVGHAEREKGQRQRGVVGVQVDPVRRRQVGDELVEEEPRAGDGVRRVEALLDAVAVGMDRPVIAGVVDR